MPELIAPTAALRESWLEARAEWGDGAHMAGSGVSLFPGFLAVEGGHIGYGVRPSARRRGLATWALGAVLPHARALGLDAVLITCDETNAASAGVIERNGGVLEGIVDTPIGRKRRYWISL